MTRSLFALSALTTLGTAVLALTDVPINGLHMRVAATRLFQTSDACIACHTNLTAPNGEDISFGPAWRGSMMANSARDPYWQASVRREVALHASHGPVIQDECAACHMPMARATARAAGKKGEVFAHLPVGAREDQPSLLAADGVSCTMCHQLSAEGLGTADTYGGNFRIDTGTAYGKRRVFGPYDIDSGKVRVMHSSSEFVPTRGDHVRQAELCASCHTLFTDALDEAGNVVGKLPEQVPYLEWQASEFPKSKTCQGCHMPPVEGEAPISGVLGTPRLGVSRHDFRGGNFFMQEVLAQYRETLGVVAPAADLMVARSRTLDFLREATARVSIHNASLTERSLSATMRIENLAGHKFPTAYPSRRAWLHIRATDASGNVVFESGRLEPNGSIVGNDNDADASRFEAHYTTLSSADQVQVYESILGDSRDRVTTSLISGARYLKDNRLLPRGAARRVAPSPIATVGVPDTDIDFANAIDQVDLRVDIAPSAGPIVLTAELLFQPIGYRWAQNLRTSGRSSEGERFVQMFNALSSRSAAQVSSASVTIAR